MAVKAVATERVNLRLSKDLMKRILQEMKEQKEKNLTNFIKKAVDSYIVRSRAERAHAANMDA